jgi:hypothetical protein
MTRWEAAKKLRSHHTSVQRGKDRRGQNVAWLKCSCGWESRQVFAGRGTNPLIKAGVAHIKNVSEELLAQAGDAGVSQPGNLEVVSEPGLAGTA